MTNFVNHFSNRRTSEGRRLARLRKVVDGTKRRALSTSANHNGNGPRQTPISTSLAIRPHDRGLIDGTLAAVADQARRLLMNDTTTKPEPHVSHFTCNRSTDGCDETFDIVAVATGEVIASLPFWYDEPETRREAQQLIAALDAFYARGGYFFMPALLRANQTIQREP